DSTSTLHAPLPLLPAVRRQADRKDRATGGRRAERRAAGM
ncbi:MAG: hypothetical protein AVDCRST_MAG56-7591, partial [uncultured Cytophagales bacterium]